MDWLAVFFSLPCFLSSGRLYVRLKTFEFFSGCSTFVLSLFIVVLVVSFKAVRFLYHKGRKTSAGLHQIQQVSL